MSEHRSRFLGILALAGAGCTTLIGLPDLPEQKSGSGASSGAPSENGGTHTVGGTAGHAGGGGSLVGGKGGTSNGGSSNGGTTDGGTAGALGGSGNGGGPVGGDAGADAAGTGDTGATGGSGKGGSGGTGGSGSDCVPACKNGQDCVSGQCMCPQDQTECSKGCVDLQTDRDNCGACEHACEDGCSAGRCYRIVASVSPGDSVVLALHGSYVYFTQFTAGTVSRVLQTGGVVEPLASSQDHPKGVAADDTNVYWANASSTDQYTGTVMARALSGGAMTTLATDELCPQYVAVDATHIYWSNEPPNPATYMSAPLAVGMKMEVASGNELTNAPQFALDGSTIYWAGYSGNSGGVWSVPAAGGTIKQLATVLGSASNATVFGGDVYFFVDQIVKKISTSASSGTSGTPVIALSSSYLSVDATGLYFGGTTNNGVENLIMQVALDTSSSATLAVASSPLYAFAVGDTDVFWVDSDGYIKATSKTP